MIDFSIFVSGGRRVMKKNIMKSVCIGIVSICLAGNICIPVCAEESLKTETDANIMKEDDLDLNNGEFNSDMLFSVWSGTIEDGTRCYYGEDGEKVTGLQKIDEYTYYFDEDGVLQTGWQKVDEKEYYFSPETGERYENIITIVDEVKYSFDNEGNAEQVLDVESEDISNDSAENNMETEADILNEDTAELQDEKAQPRISTGWQIIDGKKCYIMQGGKKHTGWLSFGRTYYYCGKDGAIVYGKQKIGNDWYYFNSEGVRQQSKWIEENGEKKYYALEDGKLRIGWLSFGKTYYYCKSDASIAYGKQKIGNAWYYFNDKGVRQQNKWIEENGEKKYYALADGKLRTGWLSFGKTYYYCGSDAAIVKNTTCNVDGKCYYFNEQGVRQKLSTGWHDINGKKGYALTDGTLHTGWLSFGSRYFYCGKNGLISYGKQKISGNWYYFDDQGLRQQNKWILENGEKKYYALADGKLRIGWLSFGSTYYYCGKDAAIIKDQSCNIDGVCYYFNKQGVRQKLATGWQDINGKRCYVLPDGTLHTGWLSFGSRYFYCGKNGAVLTGKQKIGSNWYYFDGTGLRQQNKWVVEDGQKKYYALADGKLRVGWLSFGSTYYYCKGDASIVKSQNYAVEEIYYKFDANGVMQKGSGWGTYRGNKYYKNPATGFPYKNQWVTFGKTYYYANSKGHMVSGWQTIGGYRYYFDPTTKIMARNTTIDGIKIGSNGRVVNYQDRMAVFSTVSTNDASGTYNMSKALKSFNQVVIMPGQTLSFFGVAGPCGAAQGYLPGGVVGGIGYGGGICQASTTLYGAMLRAGLTIVERGNHSVPSTYVPIGQDAMVDYGSSDLKVRNDYNFPVKLVTYVNGNTLYAEVWGSQPGWYDRVEITSWWTGSNTAIAYRNYIKNGKTVKTEQLPGSFYY